jgi:hypothetical protein
VITRGNNLGCFPGRGKDKGYSVTCVAPKIFSLCYFICSGEKKDKPYAVRFVSSRDTWQARKHESRVGHANDTRYQCAFFRNAMPGREARKIKVLVTPLLLLFLISRTAASTSAAENKGAGNTFIAPWPGGTIRKDQLSTVDTSHNSAATLRADLETFFSSLLCSAHSTGRGGVMADNEPQCAIAGLDDDELLAFIAGELENLGVHLDSLSAEERATLEDLLLLAVVSAPTSQSTTTDPLARGVSLQTAKDKGCSDS